MTLPDLLRGPAPAWPVPVEAVLDRWAGLPARARLVAAGCAASVLVLAATGGLLRGPWGPPVEVLVATADIAPGSPLDGAALATERRPRDALPDAPVAPGSLAVGSVAAGPLPAGAVLDDGHVVAGGPSAGVGDGRGLVPVPRDGLPALPPGTSLRLVAAGADGSAVTVAEDATVAADDGAHVWLDVAVLDVAGVAAAAARGALVVAVVP